MVSCRNIAVRQLPPQLQETDLTNYFAQFCPQRSDVKHVRIIQTPNHARSKAYAVVKLASDELARFICEKGQHTIKGHPVMVELHDEVRYRYILLDGPSLDQAISPIDTTITNL